MNFFILEEISSFLFIIKKIVCEDMNKRVFNATISHDKLFFVESKAW